MDIINCEIVERISKNTGNPFRAIEFTWANGFKLLFVPNDDDRDIQLMMRQPNP